MTDLDSGNRLVAGEKFSEDSITKGFRPLGLAEFVGQSARVEGINQPIHRISLGSNADLVGGILIVGSGIALVFLVPPDVSDSSSGDVT